MKIAVIGSGGREHAIIKALRASTRVSAIHAIPGSPGISADAIAHDLDIYDPSKVIEKCKQLLIDLVVIGPELPLVYGLSDSLREAGFLVFAPSAEAAKLETSKIFSKEFMTKANVPTAYHCVVQSLEDIKMSYSEFRPPYVLKADGLAGGKGVVICQTSEELFSWGKKFFEDKVFGHSGEKAILEQFTEGEELSFFVLTNGSDYRALPLAQDHKKLLANEEGPNTGGMGAVAPIAISNDQYQTLIQKVVVPTIEGLKNSNLEYRGVLYIGLIMSPSGPSVLEYNVRFGDPEAQVLLPLLEQDWATVFESVAKGELPELSWKSLCAAVVVMAAEGYPSSPQKGTLIEGEMGHQGVSSYFIHAGTAKIQEDWTVNGGRVLNAVGLGSSLEQSVENAYAQAEKVHWQGMNIRYDIGKKQISKN